jgi:hypothetical protein
MQALNRNCLKTSNISPQYEALLLELRRETAGDAGDALRAAPAQVTDWSDLLRRRCTLGCSPTSTGGGADASRISR